MMEEDYVSESFGLYEDQELIDALGMGRTPGQSLAPLVSEEAAQQESALVSTARGVAGGVRDAAQGFIDFTGEAGEVLQDKMPLGYVIIRDGNLEFSSQRPENMSEIRLPQIESGNTVSEGLVRGLSQFVTGMAISPVGKAGAPFQFIKRAAFAETLFDPEDGNLATLMKDLGVDNDFINLLDSRVGEDADAAERLKARLKQAATGTIEGAVLDGVVAATRAARSDEGFKQTIKNYFKEVGKAADARLAADKGSTTLTMGFDPTKVVDQGLAKLAPNKVVKLDPQKNQKEAKPRDESSGHAADYVPPQFGPPAHKMNMQLDEEFNPDGYLTFSADVGDNYQNLKFFISSVRGSTEFDEEVAFYRKLFEIKDNPDAEITVYRASPTDDLRYGDLVTPIKSDADYYVEQSKITRDDIIKAERKSRLESDEPVDLGQEKIIRAMDSIMELFPDDTTPSKVFSYKVKAKDIRWDGNNGLIRWGYFPEGKIETISKEKGQGNDAD